MSTTSATTHHVVPGSSPDEHRLRRMVGGGERLTALERQCRR